MNRFEPTLNAACPTLSSPSAAPRHGPDRFPTDSALPVSGRSGPTPAPVAEPPGLDLARGQDRWTDPSRPPGWMPCEHPWG